MKELGWKCWMETAPVFTGRGLHFYYFYSIHAKLYLVVVCHSSCRDVRDVFSRVVR